MRKFGTDKPELMTFEYKGKVYNMPLAGSMPATTLVEMAEAEREGNGFKYQLETMRKYIGDVVYDMTTNDVTDILKYWEEESKTQGATPGES